MNNEVKKGDNVGPPKEPRGDSLTTPDDPEFARQKALAEKIMREDREVLCKLAE